MCETSYPDDVNAHFCTVDELVAAVSRNQVESGEGFDTWTYSPSDFTRNGRSSFNNCQNLLYNSADVSDGTTARIDKNILSGGGGQIQGDVVNIIPNQPCNRTLRVLCCK